MNQAKRMQRNQRGYVLAESAAALTILLPIVFVAAFVAIEVCQVFLILGGLNQSAYWAARQIAINYGNNPTAAQQATGSLGYNGVYSNVTFANIVNSSQQFQAPAFNIATSPGSVTVTCQFQSGQHNLPTFPYPDPLHLGSKFLLSSTATVDLE